MNNKLKIWISLIIIFLLLIILLNHNVLALESLNTQQSIPDYWIEPEPVPAKTIIFTKVTSAIRNICVIIFITYIPYVAISLTIKDAKGQNVKLKKSTIIIGVLSIVTASLISLSRPLFC